MTLSVGSLFAGVGGLELGLERAGMTVSWQVEKDLYAQRVLAKHWPHVARFDDVRTVGAHNLARVDLICGGFPCQDLSRAASGWARPGLDGERSGLWHEFSRIIYELQPRWVLVENVDGVWREWVPVVRRALRDYGFTSVSLRVRAEDIGAPFKGARVFVVAQTNSDGKPARTVHAEMAELSKPSNLRRQDWGQPSPRALGVADGVPARMDRLRCCGNAVVPAVAELIGRRIVAHAEAA